MNISIDQAITIFNHLEETIVFFSPDGDYLSVCGSDVCVKEADFAGKNISDVITSETASLFKAKITESLKKNEVISFEYQVSDILNFGLNNEENSGNERHFRVRVIPCAGDMPFVVWVVYDISQLRNIEQRINNNDMEEPVTGVYNRRFLFKELNNFFQRFQRGSNGYSVIIINIYPNEKFSESFAYEVNDKIVTNFIALIKNTLRSTDIFASAGNDDFIVLLPDTPSKGAELMAGRLRLSIESHIFEIEADQICITASFGCSEVSSDDSSYDNVINRAEIALYQAKHEGGNVVNRLDNKNWKK
ncbi:MAG: hypothetical protein C0602_11645 [Denitrovibrio sp.]|nr:MAG: hypothetical protein C0602_11645 [Denitrovibrio sp.]